MASIKDRRKIGDNCTNGHPLSGDNFRVVKQTGQLKCKQCDRDRWNEAVKNEETRYHRAQKRKASQQRHERITGELAKPAIDAFEAALEKVTPKCKDNPGPYMDWDFKDEEQPNPPSRQQATILCSGCPLMRDDVCLNYALATSAVHGTWGGEVWIDGVRRK